MTKRGLTGPIIALLFMIAAPLSDTVTADETITLQAAIEKLRAKGYTIFYSSELVTPEQRVKATDLSIRLLKTQLAEQGLTLQRMAHVWLVTRQREPVPTVSGYILSHQGEAIEQASILVRGDGKSRLSMPNGYFEIQATPDQVLAFRAPGYQERSLTAAQIGHNPLVVLDDYKMESILVTGSRYRLPGENTLYSKVALAPSTLQNMPALGGDTLRVITHLPGISSLGVSAKPPIRGGLQDELLILLDGIELIEPFHLADFHHLFSTIDGRLIESVDFYTGGFPARYGNRMSGVMDIASINPVRETKTELGLSLFSSFINTRGYRDSAHPMDWLFSARRSNLADLSKAASSDWGTPRYTDAYGRIALDLNEYTQLYFGAFAIRDDVVLKDDEERAESGIETYHLWTGLRYDDRRQHASTLSLNYFQTRRRQSQILAEEDSLGALPLDAETQLLDYRLEMERISLSYDHLFSFAEHRLEAGLQMDYAWADYHFQAQREQDTLADLLGRFELPPHPARRSPSGKSIGLYVSAHFQLNDFLAIQPGLRWDMQDYYFGKNDTQASPRLGFLYQINDEISLRTSFGRFYQPQGLHELNVPDGALVFSPPQQSDQAILSVEWLPSDRLHLKAESYVKKYRNQRPRYDNLFNPFVLQPYMEPDRIRIHPDKAQVEGFELSADFKLAEHWSGTLRVGWLDARDKLLQRDAPRRWSQSQSLMAGLIWQKDDLVLSANATWHSGWHSTLLPTFLPDGASLNLEQLINNYELPEYFSLDVALRKSWFFRDLEISLNIDISNITGHNNYSGFEYDLEELEGGVGFTPSAKKTLPFAPSIGVVISF